MAFALIGSEKPFKATPLQRPLISLLIKYLLSILRFSGLRLVDLDRNCAFRMSNIFSCTLWNSL